MILIKSYYTCILKLSMRINLYSSEFKLLEDASVQFF